MAKQADSSPKTGAQAPSAPENPAPQTASPTPTKRSWISAMERVFTRRVLVALLLVSLAGHVLGATAFALKGSSKPSQPEPEEIALGSYLFAPEPTEGMPYLGARFDLHVAFFDDAVPIARQMMAQRENRVRQGVEELLRKARPGDFRDPSLVDLKRQIKDHVNQALGVRAVSDVIVTELELKRPSSRPARHVETIGAASTAGDESPSG